MGGGDISRVSRSTHSVPVRVGESDDQNDAWRREGGKKKQRGKTASRISFGSKTKV